MAVARASGTHLIVIINIDSERLGFAKAFEPNCVTYQVRPGATAEEYGNRIRDLFERGVNGAAHTQTEHDMPHLVLNCTGVESSIITAAYTVPRGGFINVAGVSSNPTISNIPFMHLSLAEIQSRFINRYRDAWPAAIRAWDGRLIDPSKLDTLVTHRFRLEDAVKAMELVGGVWKTDGGERVVKVQIVDEPEN
ncbi:hypothetical protein jhhlp_002759 [Lomentospora prolificans]|uniref:Uncharacterized protein n=1 Tax=Lomentospora prolificans TaxID=41688 RepID=A0A2N3NEX8_9PEZI|nr:hypothetical protein jhhlp_002759 [Lomentospora prolificans]